MILTCTNLNRNQFAYTTIKIIVTSVWNAATKCPLLQVSHFYQFLIYNALQMTLLLYRDSFITNSDLNEVFQYSGDPHGPETYLSERDLSFFDVIRRSGLKSTYFLLLCIRSKRLLVLRPIYSTQLFLLPTSDTLVQDLCFHDHIHIQELI